MRTPLPNVIPPAFTLFRMSLLAVLLSLAFPAPVFAVSTDIPKEQWTVFLRDPHLKEADARLNATYRRILSGMDPAGRKALVAEQRSWIRERNETAFSRHAKGSPEYIAMIAQATQAREAELRKRHIPALPENNTPSAPVQAMHQARHPTAQPGPQTTPSFTPQPSRPEDLNISVARDKATAPKGASPRALDITPADFGRIYNELALALNASVFPASPTAATSSGHSRTEQYRISDGISMQFKYLNGDFEHPEIITFIAKRFMDSTKEEKDGITYSLLNVVKTLSKKGAALNAEADAEIFAFIRSINSTFTSDASRVWKNAGLVYVVTYMRKTDLFAMVITRDMRKK